MTAFNQQPGVIDSVGRIANPSSVGRIGNPSYAGEDRPLAVFDLDGTLTLRDTFLPFLVSFGRRYRRVLPLLTLPIPIALYAARMMKDSAAKERLLVSFLAGQPMERVDEHADWFCRNWLPRRMNVAVVEQLHSHQAAGHRVILLSASPSVYVPAVARSLGVAEVICTQVAVADGRCLGRLTGANCKGHAKLTLLKDYLSLESAPGGSFAYGDSRHDLPVLRWVANGRLVRRGRLLSVDQPTETRHTPLTNHNSPLTTHESR